MIRRTVLLLPLALLALFPVLNAQTANFEWAKTFVTDTTASTISTTKGVATDANGNVYTCGWFAGVVDFDINGAAGSQLTASGPTDIFITKHDATGNFQWVKQIGSSGRDEATAMTVDFNGDLIIGGTYRFTVDFDPNAGTSDLTNPSGTEDIFLLKLDAAGNFIWAKSIEGSTSVETVYDIYTDASGNVYTTGNYTGTLDLDPGTGVSNTGWSGAQDVYIQKLDANGDFQWGKWFGGSGSDFGVSVISDNSGNVYLSGFFMNTINLNPDNGGPSVTSAGITDGYLLKLDANGDYVSSHTFGGSGSDTYSSMAFDSNNNLVLSGYFSGSVDLDPTSGTSMQTANSTDIFVQKLDANGNFLWVKTSIASTGFSVPWALEIDASNSIYVASSFEGNLTVDNTQTLSSNGFRDVVLEKLSPNGSSVWAVSYGGWGNDIPSDIALTTSGDIYTAGEINSSAADFDPTSGVQIIDGNNDQNTPVGFLQKLSQNGCAATYATDTQAACDGETFTWIDGNTYTESNNTATYTLTNAMGCDSIVTLDLTVTIVNTGISADGLTITAAAENAEEYIWYNCDNGIAIDDSTIGQSLTLPDDGNYNFAVIVTQNGCTEISECVSVGCAATTATDVHAACNEFTWIDGNTYTESNNTATHTLVNAMGCDSIVTLDLTINTVNTATSLSGTTITAAAQNAQYVWVDCDNNNLPIEGATTQSFTPATSGNYAVLITENGCTTLSDCVAVEVTTTSTFDLLSNAFSIYPNPTSGAVKLSLPEVANDVTIYVTDAQGKMIATHQFASLVETYLELGKAPGVYFIAVSRDNQVSRMRCVKH